jgi:hypothetical protein
VKHCIALCAATCAAFTAGAHAQIEYVSQNRWIEADTDYDALMISAPDFGVFDESVELTTEYEAGEGWFKEITASAEQYSMLESDRIYVTGAGWGETGPPAGSTTSWGNCHFEVVFEIQELTTYQLTGSFWAGSWFKRRADSPGDCYYSFTGPSINMQEHNSAGSIYATFDEAGVLEPGLYTFVIHGSECGEYVSFGNLLIDFQINPQPPCPWDIDKSGFVDLPDLTAALANWGACPPGPCPWDMDGSGFVDLPDLTAMLSNWGPCP